MARKLSGAAALAAIDRNTEEQIKALMAKAEAARVGLLEQRRKDIIDAAGDGAVAAFDSTSIAKADVSGREVQEITTLALVALDQAKAGNTQVKELLEALRAAVGPFRTRRRRKAVTPAADIGPAGQPDALCQSVLSGSEIVGESNQAIGTDGAQG